MHCLIVYYNQTAVNSGRPNNKESLDQERRRLIVEARSKIRVQKQPSQIGFMKKIFILFVIAMVIFEAFDNYFKITDSDVLTTLLIYEAFLHVRNNVILDIRFYNRKIELIAK